MVGMPSHGTPPWAFGVVPMDAHVPVAPMERPWNAHGTAHGHPMRTPWNAHGR